jgi:hypothetical protein
MNRRWSTFTCRQLIIFRLPLTWCSSFITFAAADPGPVMSGGPAAEQLPVAALAAVLGPREAPSVI